MTTISRLDGWPICSPADASPTSSRTPAHGLGPMWVATPSSQWTHMGVFGSSGQVHRHIKKLRLLFRYPRSEPYFHDLVGSAPDQTHIRSPLKAAAPISRVRRMGLRR